jgi:hypothetical protein
MSMEQPPLGTNQDGKIAVRQTPNPNARKFVLAGVRFEGSRNYALGSEVDEPLAAQLLALAGVYNVLLAQDFVTVNKIPDVAWSPLQAEVEAILTDYLSHHSAQGAGNYTR